MQKQESRLETMSETAFSIYKGRIVKSELIVYTDTEHLIGTAVNILIN
mgnify:CR=1 FL=1